MYIYIYLCHHLFISLFNTARRVLFHHYFIILYMTPHCNNLFSNKLDESSSSSSITRPSLSQSSSSYHRDFFIVTRSLHNLSIVELVKFKRPGQHHDHSWSTKRQQRWHEIHCYSQGSLQQRKFFHQRWISFGVWQLILKACEWLIYKELHLSLWQDLTSL